MVRMLRMMSVRIDDGDEILFGEVVLEVDSIDHMLQ